MNYSDAQYGRFLTKIPQYTNLTGQTGSTLYDSPLGAGGAIHDTGDVLQGSNIHANDIQGTIVNSTITVGELGSFGLHVDANGNFWIGNGNFLYAPFSVSSLGAITSTSGLIGNWSINDTQIYGGDAILDSSGYLVMGTGNNIVRLDATNATYRMWIGNALATSAPISFTKDGIMRLGLASGTHLKLDGPNIEIESSNYVSGPLGAGFHIDTDLAEFGNIRARGKITTSVVEKDTISAIGGQLVVANADILNADMTAADNSTLTILGDTTLSVNDILIISDGVDIEYMRVTNIASAPTYTVTRDLNSQYAANTNPIWKKGTAVSVFGASDGSTSYSGGWLFLKGAGTNAPYYAVVQRTGVGATDYTEYARLGNLNGFLGNTTNVYGVGIGDNTRYLKYTPEDGLDIRGKMYLFGIYTLWDDWESGGVTWEDKSTVNWEDVGAGLRMAGDVSFVTSDTYQIGNTTSYPNKIYSHWYYAKETSIQSFDVHDDIASLKSLQTKTVKVKNKGVEKDAEIFDLSTLPADVKEMIEYKNGFFNTQKYLGLLTGTIKQLITRLNY